MSRSPSRLILVAVFGLTCWPPVSANNHDLRRQMMGDIQSALNSRQPSIWGSFEGNYQVAVEWQFSEMNGLLTFRRQVRKSPDGGVSVTETWQMNALDLPKLGAIWGHPDVLAWDELLGEIENGRIVADEASGMILILREFPINTDLRRIMPFPLDAIPTESNPLLTFEDRLNPQGGSRFANFMSDLFLDEVLDLDGVPISISKRYHIEGQFSRISPKVRVERRIRLDLAGTYSVFDVYGFGAEFLLGNRDNDEDSEIEEGAFFNFEKSVVVIREGYQRWFDALFTKIIPLRELPYSSKSFDRMPVGIRVVYPSTSGITLEERRRRTTSLGDTFPWKLDSFIGLQGTFFVSVRKQSSQSMELRFGGRVERLLELDTRIRPDFDGPIDPLRLVFGTIVQLRSKKGFGTRLFMQRLIDLENELDVANAHEALQRGVRINGLAFGVAAAINFSFRRDIDEYLVERFIRGRLPEMTWDRAVYSRYNLTENYAKFGIRYINVRRDTNRLDDDWRVENFDSGVTASGRALSYATRHSFRVLDIDSRRTTQLRGFLGAREFSNQDAFIELVSMYEDDRMTYDEYDRILGRFEHCIGPSLDLSELRDWPAEKIYRNAQIGYRLVFTKEAVSLLVQRLVAAERDQPIRRWLRYHPILTRRLNKYQDDPDRYFPVVSHILFKMSKRNGPIADVIADMPADSLLVEWQGRSDQSPTSYHSQGQASLDANMLQAWQTWETISVIDDLFVEQSLQSRTR